MQPEPPPNECHVVTQQKLLACRDCDLLQREVGLVLRSDAHCTRCGALLYRETGTRLDWMIALTVGSAVLFLVSNLFPIAVLEVQGSRSTTTLSGTVLALYDQGRPLVAVLVLVTTILVPALELAAMLYMLIPLRLGRIAPDVPATFRFVLAVHPWNMMEVFMLGVLVTLVKLADLATIIPGIALWAFAGLIVLFSTVSASFSARDFWTWVDSIRCAASDERR